MTIVSKTVKYATIAAVILVAAIFAIAGAATPFSQYEKDGFESYVHYDKVRTCVDGDCETQSIDDSLPGTCDPFEHGCRAALAFSVLSVLVMALVLILCVLLIIFNLPKIVKLLAGGAIGLATFMMLVAWPIGFALHSRFPCNDKKLSDTNDRGPSAYLLLVSFVFLVVAVVLSRVLKEIEEEDRCEKMSNDPHHHVDDDDVAKEEEQSTTNAEKKEVVALDTTTVVVIDTETEEPTQKTNPLY